ncbi:MAG: RNA-binding protein [Cyanobacteria bacterium P01_D01_bin.56]
MSIFVGNLSYEAGQQDLDRLFRRYGHIVKISLPFNRKLNRPRGFAFMEMESASEEEKAIKALDGTEFLGRALNVTHAHSEKGFEKSQPHRKQWHRCIPFYRRPLFYGEDRFFS